MADICEGCLREIGEGDDKCKESMPMFNPGCLLESVNVRQKRIAEMEAALLDLANYDEDDVEFMQSKARAYYTALVERYKKP